jgi:two-component system, chemotaxis family, protein-glutamate methylesterase/glutaminase
MKPGSSAPTAALNGKPINPQRIKRNVIVIGGSAGGIEVLLEVLRELPPSFPAAIAVVLHRSPHGSGHLASVLGRRSALPVSDAEAGMPFTQGRIYLAPSDHHMTVRAGRIGLNRGPREHGTRPSIDALFHSAADVYGRRVAALLLSGGGDDGVEGMIAIKAKHGLSFVQDPKESSMPFMPMNALLYDNVDAVLPVPSMGAMLMALATGRAITRYSNLTYERRGGMISARE